MALLAGNLVPPSGRPSGTLCSLGSTHMGHKDNVHFLDQSTVRLHSSVWQPGGHNVNLIRLPTTFFCRSYTHRCQMHFGNFSSRTRLGIKKKKKERKSSSKKNLLVTGLPSVSFYLALMRHFVYTVQWVYSTFMKTYVCYWQDVGQLISHCYGFVSCRKSFDSPYHPCS